MFFFFFFKQKTAYEIRKGDWSSDVCSSDLLTGGLGELVRGAHDKRVECVARVQPHPRVTIVVDETAAAESAPAPTPTRAGGTGTAEGLNPRYTFDAFVVGSSNQFAQDKRVECVARVQ